MEDFDRVEAYLQAQPQGTQVRHRASSIVMCPRRSWFRLKGQESAFQPTLAHSLKMRLGGAIADIWRDLLEESGHALTKPGTVADGVRSFCPAMYEDLLRARSSEHAIARRFREGRFTIAELPTELRLPGVELGIGMQLDIVYLADTLVPRISEVKTSFGQRTRNMKEGLIPPEYVIQLGLYHYRYPELPAFLHYFDRETCYPVAYHIQKDHLVGPGLYTPIASLFNGLPLLEYTAQRLAWIEELLLSDGPPGEIVSETVLAPRDPQKEFYVIGLRLDHSTMLDEAYHCLVSPDGTLLRKKKQANKVEYKPGYCPYCEFIDICTKEAHHPIVAATEEETDKEDQ